MMLEALVPDESHHIGCSLSIVEILTFLYFNHLNVYPHDPKNVRRDIFILSKGHGSLALYATLCRRGFFSKKLLMTYDKNGSKLPEHASSNVPGVELSTGSLGHGLSVGIGLSTAFKNDNKNNKVFVLLSDGELDEGSNWEAIMYAGYHHLDNLIAIVDKNDFQGYAATSKVLDLSPLCKKITPFQWNVYETDGHDFLILKKTFDQINKSKNGRPHFIIAQTIKGRGVPYFEGKFESHYKSVDKATKQKIIGYFKTTL